jgi:hypothetical protein
MGAICEQFFTIGATDSTVRQLVSWHNLDEEYMLINIRYGVDGTWSTITIGVGTESPRKWMDVMVSTVSSETWVVGAGGCGNSSSPGE